MAVAVTVAGGAAVGFGGVFGGGAVGSVVAGSAAGLGEPGEPGVEEVYEDQGEFADEEACDGAD